MNIFKLEAQRQKAEKLYLALAKAGATLEQLRAMGAEQWDLAARAAQCSFPSIETRQMVIALAEQRCAAVIRSEQPTREYNFSAEIADGLAEIEAAAAGATVAMDEFAAAMEPYRPTAEEEDAEAGLDEDEDIMAAYWRCQGGSR